MYPIGSIYISVNPSCPLETLGIGIWILVAKDRVLQGAGDRGQVGTTLNESLPNISGKINIPVYSPWVETVEGAFIKDVTKHTIDDGSDNTYNSLVLNFNASHSSNTYKDNAPVQPDAYLVNIFRRVQ